MKTRIQKSIALTALMILGISFAFAQDGSTKRNYQFEVGDIISSTTGDLQGELHKSKQVNDDNIVGVFTGLNSARRDEVIKSKGVMSVNCSADNGAIKKGDYVASSADGKAIKAEGDATVLGVALEDATNGKVKVRLDIHFQKNINISQK